MQQVRGSNISTRLRDKQKTAINVCHLFMIWTFLPAKSTVLTSQYKRDYCQFKGLLIRANAFTDAYSASVKGSQVAQHITNNQP
jgi:hypothetical protein